MTIRSVTLVVVQLLALGYLVLTGPLIVSHPLVWLEIVGCALGGWAIYMVKPRHVRVLPEVDREAHLVTKGPYRFIRHPMYASVLLITLAWLLDRVTLARLVVWFILVTDLVAKLRYEERLLAKRFSEYAAYQRRTKRVIPFLF
jgi:protein-S-isoprenylcysteine O-methyltransferase Ste14